jgi:hypothetical protein
MTRTPALGHVVDDVAARAARKQLDMSTQLAGTVSGGSALTSRKMLRKKYEHKDE